MRATDYRATLDRVRLVLAGLGGLGVVATMVLIFADVCLRVIGVRLPGTYEIVTNYFMPMIAFLPLMNVERLGQMISVEIIAGIGGPQVQAAILRLGSGVAAVVYCALAYTTLIDALQKASVRSYVVAMNLRIDTWPPYFLLPLGFAAAAVVAIDRMVTGQGLPAGHVALGE